MFGFSLTQEQEQLRDTARRFAEQEMIPVAARYDEEEKFPEPVARKAWELGLLNPKIPREHGGLELGVLDSCILQEQLNYGCSGIANVVAANGLAALPLILAGNEEQKRQYLGMLTAECSYAAFAITEPGAGSDVAGMQTSFRRVGDEYVINGTKHFISNGTVASWYTAFARPEKTKRHEGITCFVFPSDLPGITTNKMRHKLGQRAADTAEIVFEDVRVPKTALVGDEGHGFKIAMRTFDRSRPEIASVAVGISQRALDESVRYAQERQQFGQPIASFQAIQFMLANMAIEIEAMRLLTYKAAWLIDEGDAAPIVSSYAKAFGADAAMRITTDAVQVFGGYGYMKEYPVEKLMRDAKLLQIYEGTSQIQRVVIARNLLRT